jgi:hypothetical protein
VFALALLSACATTSTSASKTSPSPAVSSEPVASPSPTSVAAADAMIRATVTGAHPLLLPTAIPAGWTALVGDVTPAFFNVTYSSADGSESVYFAIEVPNPPPPGAHGTQAKPNFHTDRRSLYQVDDATKSTGARWLMWNEPGTWSMPNGLPGVPYFMSSEALTGADFWKIANSVHT